MTLDREARTNRLDFLNDKIVWIFCIIICRAIEFFLHEASEAIYLYILTETQKTCIIKVLIFMNI